MASWPTSLPCIFLDATDVRQDATLRTAMDAGPSKARRRFSAASRLVSSAVTLDATQRGTLDTFFAVTLAEGSLEFDIDDPFGGATVSARFVSPPSYTYRSRSSTGARWYVAALSMEILP